MQRQLGRPVDLGLYRYGCFIRLRHRFGFCTRAIVLIQTHTRVWISVCTSVLTRTLVLNQTPTRVDVCQQQCIKTLLDTRIRADFCQYQCISVLKDTHACRDLSVLVYKYSTRHTGVCKVLSVLACQYQTHGGEDLLLTFWISSLLNSGRSVDIRPSVRQNLVSRYLFVDPYHCCTVRPVELSEQIFVCRSVSLLHCPSGRTL